MRDDCGMPAISLSINYCARARACVRSADSLSMYHSRSKRLRGAYLSSWPGQERVKSQIIHTPSDRDSHLALGSFSSAYIRKCFVILTITIFPISGNPVAAESRDEKKNDNLSRVPSRGHARIPNTKREWHMTDTRVFSIGILLRWQHQPSIWHDCSPSCVFSCWLYHT